MDDINYCPPCFKVPKYMSNDDNIRLVNKVVSRTVNTDDGVITEFNTKINSDDKVQYKYIAFEFKLEFLICSLILSLCQISSESKKVTK